MDLTDLRRHLDIVGKGQERTVKKSLVKEEITANTTPADAVQELQGQKYDMANSQIRVSFDATGLDPTDDVNPIGQEKLYDLGRKLKSIDVEPKDDLSNEWDAYKQERGASGTPTVQIVKDFVQSKEPSLPDDEIGKALRLAGAKSTGLDKTLKQSVALQAIRDLFGISDTKKTLTQKMADDGRTVDQATNAEAIDHLEDKGASEEEAKGMIQTAGGDPDDGNATLDDTTDNLAKVVANSEDEGTLTPDQTDEPEAGEEASGKDEEEGGEVTGTAAGVVADFEEITPKGAYKRALDAARKANETKGESAGSELAKLGAAFLIANKAI